MPPVVSDEFAWVAAPWGQALQCRALGVAPHGWTSRQLQLRGSPDVESAGWLDSNFECPKPPNTDKSVDGRRVTLPASFVTGVGAVEESAAFTRIIRLVR